MVWARPVTTSKLLDSPVPTPKKILYWRLVGPTCLIYAGENTDKSHLFKALYSLVSFPDPTLKEGKGLVYIECFLGCTGCSISCDWHDNTSFWHGNASTTLIRVQYKAIEWCHMIITCKPHGMNLIGTRKFRNESHQAPESARCIPHLFPPWGRGLGTRLYTL